MQGKVARTAIPNRHCGCSNEYAGVVGERQTEGKRGSLSGIFQNPQGQRRSVTIAEKIGEGSRRCTSRESQEGPDADRHRALWLEDPHHRQKALGATEIRNEQGRRDHRTGSGNPSRMADELAIGASVVGNGSDDRGGTCGSPDEKVERNLPCPRGLLEQWNLIVAVLWRGLREWHALGTSGNHLQ